MNFTETKKNVMDDFQRGSFLGKLPYHTFLDFLIKKSESLMWKGTRNDGGRGAA